MLKRKEYNIYVKFKTFHQLIGLLKKISQFFIIKLIEKMGM